MSATAVPHQMGTNQRTAEISTERAWQAYKTISSKMVNDGGEATTTERSALLQLAMLSSCICGRNACISCGEPIADHLQNVIDYVVGIGPHNDMITSRQIKTN